MYKFVLIQNKEILSHKWWTLYIDSAKDYHQYYEKFVAIKDTEAMLDVAEHCITGKHMTTRRSRVIKDHLTNAFNGKFALSDSKVHEAVYTKFHANKIKYILNGMVLLFNINGGFCVLNNTFQILDTIETEKFEFPVLNENPEKIIIHQWRGGKHWYLTSDRKREFETPKFNSLSNAYNEALKFTTIENISKEESKMYMYLHDGD